MKPERVRAEYRSPVTAAERFSQTGRGQAAGLHFAVLLLLLAGVGAVRAAEANSNGPSASGLDYPSFRIIAERNIFDPNRTGRANGRSYTRRESDRPARTESFALLGTMSYEKGRFAFFDGSSPTFKRALKPADTIAGFKLAEVALTCVKLESTNGQTLDLCVGMQMKRREDEDWQLAGRVETSESGRPALTANATSGTDAGSDEVLKRLMQRREADTGAPASEPSGEAARSDVAQAEAREIEAPGDNPSGSDTNSGNETNDALRKLLQRREQELNK